MTLCMHQLENRCHNSMRLYVNTASKYVNHGLNVCASLCGVCRPLLSQHTGDVISQYRKELYSLTSQVRTRSAHMSFAMRLLILIPEFLGAVSGVFSLIDPLGYTYIFDFITARLIFNFRGAIITVTDIIMIVYCTDIIGAFRQFKSSEQYVPFLVR